MNTNQKLFDWWPSFKKTPIDVKNKIKVVVYVASLGIILMKKVH